MTNRTMIIAHHTGETDKFIDVKPLAAWIQRFEIEPVIKNARDLGDLTLRQTNLGVIDFGKEVLRMPLVGFHHQGFSFLCLSSS